MPRIQFSRVLLVTATICFVLTMLSSCSFGQGIPDSVRKKFSQYVGNWKEVDQIDGNVVSEGRISLIALPHGEGFEYRYAGSDKQNGEQVNSIGIIGWDESKQKLVEFNVGNSGSSFSSEFKETDDGYSAPITGVGKNTSGKLVPFRGERALSNSGNEFVVVSHSTYEGDKERRMTSTFTRVSRRSVTIQAAQNAFEIYDDYFGGVWDMERTIEGETVKGRLNVLPTPTGNAHLVTATFDDGTGFIDLWTYDQRAGTWSGVFGTEFGHGGSEFLPPLTVDKITPGFKFTGIGVDQVAGIVSWPKSNWKIVSEDEYTIESSDRLGNAPRLSSPCIAERPGAKRMANRYFGSLSIL